MRAKIKAFHLEGDIIGTSFRDAATLSSYGERGKQELAITLRLNESGWPRVAIFPARWVSFGTTSVSIDPNGVVVDSSTWTGRPSSLAKVKPKEPTL